MTPPDPIVIFMALLIDLLIGDPRWLPHPVIAMGRLIHVLDSGLRRTWLNERIAGGIMLLLVVCLSAATALILIKSATMLAPLAGWISAVLVSSTCLAARSLHAESAHVASALRSGDLPTARRMLSYIVGRDTDALEEPEIWRALVETVAENTSDGIIAPLFWLTLGGPVAGIAYKAVSTLDSMVGYRNDRYRNLGWASARMDDLLNFIPARISAMLLIVTAPLVGGSAFFAARITLRDRRKHPSPNSGHPEAAAAGALGVRLGGAASYSGSASWKEYIGDQRQPLDENTYRDMITLMYLSTLLMAAACMAVLIFLRGFHVPFL